MVLGISLLSTRTQHFAIIVHEVGYDRIGPFRSHGEATAFAASECVRLGPPRAYVGASFVEPIHSRFYVGV
jgi:hypothetical protein